MKISRNPPTINGAAAMAAPGVLQTQSSRSLWCIEYLANLFEQRVLIKESIRFVRKGKSYLY